MSLPPDGKNWMSDREWEQVEQDQVPDTWVCAWCGSGQHANCTMGLRCDCNAGRGDCWGHLPPKKLKLVHDDDEITLVSEPISTVTAEPTVKRTFKW